MIQCQEVEYCKINVEYMANPETVKEKREEAISTLRKEKVKVPGYRPGKAPIKVIKKVYKKHIEDWVKREMLTTAYDETLHETKMKPIGYPTIHTSFLDGCQFHCQMTFLKKPEFELKEYKEFKIPKPHMESVDSLLEKEMEILRRRYGTTSLYGENDFVQVGDKVTMDVQGFVGEELVAGLNQQGLMYTVGENSNEEFDTNLLGMKAGDTREFNIKFDDSEKHTDEVRGKELKFKVTVHMGTKNIPSTLDDELAKKLNCESLIDLENKILSQLNAMHQQREQQLVREQIIIRLVQNHEFEVPTWLTSVEAQRMAAQNGLKWDELSDDQMDSFVVRAKDAVKLSLILDSIRENEPEVVFSAGELLNHLSNLMQSQGKTKAESEKIMNEAQKTGSLHGIIAALRDELTIKYLQEKCQIVD